MDIKELPHPLRFEWDMGNKIKSLTKHGVTNQEAEEVFLNFNIIFKDDEHSQREERWLILGRSDKGKNIISSFTVRDSKLRIVTSRVASKKERQIYEKTFKENS